MYPPIKIAAILVGILHFGENMERKYLKYKNYAHFDKRMSIKKAEKLFLDDETINKHGFFPFINFKIKSRKFENNEKNKRTEPKTRDIYYAAHLDRYIYQKYANEIGVRYNEYVKINNIDGCSVAYRSGLGKCNIDFAKEAFEAIKTGDKNIIIIGDFTNFFDNLDHKHLKSRLKTVLKKELDNNLYKVFKSITKFNYISVDEIYVYLTKKEGKRSEKFFMRTLKQIMTNEEFKEFVKMPNVLQKNKKDYGIVQGSSLSGLLANIYMILFDKKMNELAKLYNGKYMRYSDDFILIMDGKSDGHISKVYEQIQMAVLEAGKIQLKPEKTNVFKYDKHNIECINEKILYTNNVPNIINFLGFSFDGIDIKIRNKTITKYNYKMIKNIKHYKNGKNISLKQIYNKFTFQGLNKKRGNFISYVKRAEKIFKNENSIEKVRKKSKEKVSTNLSKMNKEQIKIN